MTHPPPTFKRVAMFIIAFEMFTIPIGLWAWRAGLAFWTIVPGAILCGMTGGAFLSSVVFTLQTGYMQRMSSFYRFSERPITFIMDFICVVLAVTLSVAWPIGYARQELAKLPTPTEKVPR